MLRCQGEVVRYESRPWAMEGRTGVSRTARVQTTRADFIDVTIPEGFSPEPRDGDTVDWAVVPGVSNGKVRVTVRSVWSAAAPARPAEPRPGPQGVVRPA